VGGGLGGGGEGGGGEGGIDGGGDGGGGDGGGGLGGGGLGGGGEGGCSGGATSHKHSRFTLAQKATSSPPVWMKRISPLERCLKHVPRCVISVAPASLASARLPYMAFIDWQKA
jgi:hypothetical protein